MASVYTVYHSGFGHTQFQAEAVHRGAGSVSGIQANLRTTEEASANLDELDQADAIIYGQRVAEITVRWTKAKA